ncbi:MAG: heparan-alpha-glucosaminide N-acetyltransferase domain-containing protein [Massiliimalia sp.]|jgi:uncharacterized membrane protein
MNSTLLAPTQSSSSSIVSLPKSPSNTIPRNRNGILDVIRGITMVSMILYHGVWDCVYLLHQDWQWFSSDFAYVWQQSICWVFILLSGFCWSYSKHPVKRGLIVSGAGILVSVATWLIMPENQILFGVLTLIGFCMLIMTGLHPILKQISALWGTVGFFVLFLLTKSVNQGFLGFDFASLFLPKYWYQGMIATFLGFPDPAFRSTDYFSVFPWMFLFITGYFLHKLLADSSLLRSGAKVQIQPFAFLGKHSMIIYLIHQPVLYGILSVFSFLTN